MTDSEYQTWLEDPSAIRILLVELTVYDVVAVANKTFYLSSGNYTTTSADVSYSGIISKGIDISETLDISGESAGISFGDLELYNPLGELDAWLDAGKFIWVNKSIKMYYGDPRWVCANQAAIYNTFRLVFNGTIADIDSRSRTTVNIKIRDKLERLNAPITESVLGTTGTWSGGQTNKDTAIPLTFGEVFNATPLLRDPSTLSYQFNNGQTELLIEIRDNGVPIYTHNGTSIIIDADTPTTVSLSTGIFSLPKPLVGTCTVSLQGLPGSIDSSGNVAAYNNNIARIIAYIVTQLGKASTKLSASTELDLTNLNAFATANTQKIGVYIEGRENVLNVCQQIASSVGAQLFMSREGKLQLLQIGVPTADTSVAVTDDDIIEGTLQISQSLTPVAAVRLAYGKNYTTQEGLATGIPQAAKTEYAIDVLTVTATDSTVKSLYSLDTLPEPKETVLIVTSEAQTEAQRLLDYYKVAREVFKFTGTSRLLSLKLGQAVTLKHNRFNLSTAKSGQVVSLAPNWIAGTIEVEVLI